MYSDYIRKLEYYKQRAIKQLVKYGIPLNTGNIEKELVDIDLSISILNQEIINNDERFDVNVYNKMVSEIMADLNIIYAIIDEEIIDQLNQSKRRAQSSLNSLLKKADADLTRLKIESTAGFIGKNLMEQVSDFEFYQTNEYLNVDMGTFRIKEGTYVSFIADVGNDLEDVQLNLSYNGEDVTVMPYTEAQQHIVQIGNSRTISYDVTLDEDVQIDNVVYLKSADVSEMSEYQVLSQKGCYKMTLSNGTEEFVPFDNESSYINGVEVSLYVKDATYVKFAFGLEPVAKNFESNNITNPSAIEYFNFNYEPETINEDLTFILRTDGKVYGQQEIGTVDDEGLYIVESNGDTNYTIVEEQLGDEIEVSAIAKIKDGVPDLVRGLVIRQIGV